MQSLKIEGYLIKKNIELAEELILKAFKDEPFHTLFFLYDFVPPSNDYGGTCSDKVLSIKRILTDNGFEVHLHSSMINNIECHRLLKLIIDEQEYFADVGNGWPSIKLFPANEGIKYTCYGITFESKVFSKYIEIHQSRDGISKHTVTIPLESKIESEIMEDISFRYEKLYPFSGKLRFAQIINDQFIFLRDSELSIYSESGVIIKTGNFIEHLRHILDSEFDFDLDRLLCLKAQ